MTIYELMVETNVQGMVKVQYFDSNDTDMTNPIVVFEETVDCCFPSELNEYMDCEIKYIYPYIYTAPAHRIDLNGAGICIEIEALDI